MKANIELDLQDTCLALEALVKRLPKMTRQERIDVAARMKAVAKHAATIDEAVKEEIKAHLRNREGDVLGENFKAHLALVSATRLDQQKLKVEFPNVYDTCLKKAEDRRITFEAR